MDRLSRFSESRAARLLVAAVIVLLLRVAVPLLWPLAGGFALAYLFGHISRRIRLRAGAPTALIALCFYTLAVLLFWGAAVFALDRIFRAAKALPVFWQEVLQPASEALAQRFTGWLARFSPSAAAPLEEWLTLASAASQELAGALSVRLLALVSAGVRAMPEALVGFLFLIVSSVYICMDYTRVSRFLMRQLPPPAQRLLLGARDFLTRCLWRTVRAYALISLITFAELWIGMRLLGVGSWRTALLIALCDILPLIGSGAFLAPWGIYHLALGNPGAGLGLLALWGIITVVRNLIEPRILGDHLGLHPVAAIVSLFLGLRLLGVWGALAAPFAAMLVRYLNEEGGLRLYRGE